MHYAVSDYLLDIIQNSLEAEADSVDVAIDDEGKVFSCTVQDNGKGMSQEELERIRDPFYTAAGKHAHRKVGLGIPFLEQTMEATGGKLEIASVPGEGTRLSFQFAVDHVDTPPVGDIPATLLAAMTYPGDFELTVVVTVRRPGVSDSYELRRSELIDVLGDIRFGYAQALLQDYIRSQDESLERIRKEPL
ncbi:MAG: ATP-binding protein [Spirochaetota bacterium]